jgi:hypothetical protein
VVSLEGNDLPLRDSLRYEFCSSIHLTFLILCSTFGLGSSWRRRTRTSLVRSTGWSMPRSGERRTLLPWSLPAHHMGSHPCDSETRRTGWRGDNWYSTYTSRSTPSIGWWGSSASSRVRQYPLCHVCRLHRTGELPFDSLSIFRYKYSVVNNFMFHVLC